jgi:hypothetical protein
VTPFFTLRCNFLPEATVAGPGIPIGIDGGILVLPGSTYVEEIPSRHFGGSCLRGCAEQGGMLFGEAK